MNRSSTIKRLLKEMTGKYKAILVFVFLFILISTPANIAGSFFVRRLVDDYISPLLLSDVPEFTGLLKALYYGVHISCRSFGYVFIQSYDDYRIARRSKENKDDMFAHAKAAD